MIRTLSNNHRPWSLALFVLALGAGMGLCADRAVAGPTDLDAFRKRSALRPPARLGELKATAVEVPVVIGPVPGFSPWDRYPHHWTPVASTQRGPRAKRGDSHRIILSGSQLRSAR